MCNNITDNFQIFIQPQIQMQFVWPLLSNMAIHHIPSLHSPRVQLGPQTKYPFKFRNSFRKSPRKVNFVARNIFTGRLISCNAPSSFNAMEAFNSSVLLMGGGNCSPLYLNEIKIKFWSSWSLPERFSKITFLFSC